MTNDQPTTDPQPTPTTGDPMRALDGVPTPDAWDDIVERAANPTADDLDADRLVGAHPARARWLAAAAVVVVVALVGGLVLANRDDGADLATTPGAGAGGGGMTVKQHWILTSFTRNAGPLAVPDPDGDRPAVLDLTVEGRVTFTACNKGGGPGRVEGDRLVMEDEWFSTAAGCIGGDGEDRMALDDAMSEFLLSDPTFESATGRDLRLTSMATVAEFRLLAEPGNLELRLVRDGDATCEVGLPATDPTRPGGAGAPVDSTALTAGPADPKLVTWDPPAGSRAVQGTWHLSRGVQVVEIQVPGTWPIDFVGERTRRVELADGSEATLWFTQDWVQLLAVSTASQPEGSPCSSYTITVAGPDEAANAELAQAVARYLVIAETTVTDEAATTTTSIPGDGEAEPTTTTAPDSAEPVTTTSIGGTDPTGPATSVPVTTTSIASDTTAPDSATTTSSTTVP